MDSMIQFENWHNERKYEKSIPVTQISDITFVPVSETCFEVSIYAGGYNYTKQFDDDAKARFFYNDCLKKIDNYYQATVSQATENLVQYSADKNDEAKKEISFYHNKCKKYGNAVDVLLCYVYTLCELIKPGYAESGHNDLEAREFVKNWIERNIKA